MGNKNGKAAANGAEEKSGKRRFLILGASGRDYHTFNTLFRLVYSDCTDIRTPALCMHSGLFRHV